MAPTLETLHRYADHFNASGTLRFFGVKISFPSLDRVQAIIDPVADMQRGGLGTQAVNGGVLAAMFDLVLGASAALVDPTTRSATMQLSMSFERPLLGTRLVAEAKIDRAGKDVLFSSATIAGADGVVCARAQGVMKLTNTPWPSGASPAIN